MNQNDTEPEGAVPQSPSTRQVPLHDLLGIRPLEMGAGRGRLDLVVKEQHLRTFGILHGGVFAAMLDAVMGMAASSTARAGDDVVTVQLNVNFLRPVALGETVVATSKVVHAGRRTAVVRGEIRTTTNALAAVGSGTFMFLPPTGATRGGIGPLSDTDEPPD